MMTTSRPKTIPEILSSCGIPAHSYQTFSNKTDITPFYQKAKTLGIKNLDVKIVKSKKKVKEEVMEIGDFLNLVLQKKDTILSKISARYRMEEQESFVVEKIGDLIKIDFTQLKSIEREFVDIYRNKITNLELEACKITVHYCNEQFFIYNIERMKLDRCQTDLLKSQQHPWLIQEESINLMLSQQTDLDLL